MGDVTGASTTGNIIPNGRRKFLEHFSSAGIFLSTLKSRKRFDEFSENRLAASISDGPSY